MGKFHIKFTGDYCGTDGKPNMDMALDLLEPRPEVSWGFLEDQCPRPGDAGYQDKLYSLSLTPEHVASADAIVVLRPWVQAPAFAQGAGRLIAIGRSGIGYDKFDLSACAENDVLVFNSPFGLTHSTASSALIFILMLARKLPLLQRMVRDYRWDLQKDAIGTELAGKVLGIVGFGQTARELVRLLAPFGMIVKAYSPHADPAQARELGVTLVDELHPLLRESDFVSLHTRLDANNHRSFGEREFACMKPSAFLINIARGELVDEEVMIHYLREHRIAGAGLDVFETEPLPLSSPLLQLDNVVLTPHWLATTREAGRATIVPIIQGLLGLTQGIVPGQVLNPAVLNRKGFLEKLARWKGAAK